MCSNLFNEDMFSAGPEKAAIFKEDIGRGLHILKISEADICTNLASAIFALVV